MRLCRDRPVVVGPELVREHSDTSGLEQRKCLNGSPFSHEEAAECDASVFRPEMVAVEVRPLVGGKSGPIVALSRLRLFSVMEHGERVEAPRRSMVAFP